MVVDDEKFELSTICPGFILGPVLQGSSCTNMEVCDLFTLTSHAYVGYNFLFYVILYYSQFHRRLLQREVPMVPNLCFAMCDVRDVAGAHIKAMTSPKAPGKKKNVNVNVNPG